MKFAIPNLILICIYMSEIHKQVLKSVFEQITTWVCALCVVISKWLKTQLLNQNVVIKTFFRFKKLQYKCKLLVGNKNLATIIFSSLKLILFRERFINLVDAEKCGLPRVLDTLEVSCKTKYNIRHLANLIYDTAFSLRSQVL